MKKKLIDSLTFYFSSVHLHNRKLLLQRASLTQYSLNCIDPGIFIKYLQWVISWDILDKEASPLVLLQFSRVIQRTQITTMIMQVTPPLLPLSMEQCFHISKQKMLQPSSHHITTTPPVSPEGTQDGIGFSLSSSHLDLQLCSMVSPEETQDVETQDTGPR